MRLKVKGMISTIHNKEGQVPRTLMQCLYSRAHLIEWRSLPSVPKLTADTGGTNLQKEHIF